jgi:hypothetical protein
VIVSTALVTPIAVFLESRRLRYLDDDIVLIVVPILLLGVAFGQVPW